MYIIFGMYGTHRWIWCPHQGLVLVAAPTWIRICSGTLQALFHQFALGPGRPDWIYLFHANKYGITELVLSMNEQCPGHIVVKKCPGHRLLLLQLVIHFNLLWVIIMYKLSGKIASLQCTHIQRSSAIPSHIYTYIVRTKR